MIFLPLHRTCHRCNISDTPYLMWRHIFCNFTPRNYCFNSVYTCSIALLLSLKYDVTKFRIPPPHLITQFHTSSTPSAPLKVWRNLWMPPNRYKSSFFISVIFIIASCLEIMGLFYLSRWQDENARENIISLASVGHISLFTFRSKMYLCTRNIEDCKKGRYIP